MNVIPFLCLLAFASTATATQLTVSSLITSGITGDPGYDAFLFNCDSASFTFKLPDISTMDGQTFILKRQTGNGLHSVTVVSEVSGQTIDGDTSMTLSPGWGYRLLATNSKWYVTSIYSA